MAKPNSHRRGKKGRTYASTKAAHAYKSPEQALRESLATLTASMLCLRRWWLLEADLSGCPNSPLATVVLDLLPDGRIHISSTCCGKPDASYAPMADARVGKEVDVLVAELRERLGAISKEVGHV